jgi:hypothetical protein
MDRPITTKYASAALRTATKVQNADRVSCFETAEASATKARAAVGRAPLAKGTVARLQPRTVDQ